jgi:hypothetical protein
MKISGFLVVAMIGVSAFGDGADAHTQSAMAGHGWPTFIDPCFSSSFAQVANTCSSGGSRLLIVPMQVPTSANYQASARAAGAGAYEVTTCQAMAIGPNNNGFSFSALRSSNVSTTPVTITLGPIGVPPQGTAHFECRLGQWVADFNGGGSGGRLINVELI